MLILNELVPAEVIPTTPAVEVTATDVCGTVTLNVFVPAEVTTAAPAPVTEVCTCEGGILMLKELVPAELMPTTPAVEVTATDVCGTVTLNVFVPAEVTTAAPAPVREVCACEGGILMLKELVPGELTPTGPRVEVTATEVGATLIL